MTFTIHEKKLNLYPLQILDKAEKRKRLLFINDIIGTFGYQITSSLNKRLVCRIKFKDEKAKRHVVDICYGGGPILHLFSLNTFMNIRGIVIDSKTYSLKEPGAELIQEWLMGVAGILKGHELELIHHVQSDSSFKETWSRNFYRNGYFEIHASILAYMKKLIHKDSDILELCGGDGGLASKILDETTPRSYTLIDYNEDILKIAKSELAGKKARIVTCDLSITPLKNVVEGPFDIIMGSGALTIGVVSEETATSVLAQTLSLLKEGGYLVLSGLQGAWINRETLENYGFKVFNTFCLQSRKHLYVAQRN